MADMRTCIGSAKFGIEAHEAPVEDFPVQASQKDGRGRICRPHWTQYTRALRTAANTPVGRIDSPVQAAARVATKRAARVAAGTTSDADVQRSLLAKIRAAGGSIPAVEPAPGA